ncbi:MAG: ATP synthase F1 subunit gamma [Clostridium sp.]|nr:ATP synthase F1 subunit gamma [Prevotella sp.]MCM1429431.1 ATP synthase F1 subunit gamma [Clostridium sp.]MCM1475534.1 ATP synthase F1 subunit gamma [Muribaculaceae bacterium]
MATLRELKTRIGSVASSEKITGAMKMISSAKVHKNEAALRQLQPYKNQIQKIMAHILDSGTTFSSPLIESRDVKNIGIIIFGSDDGLCGAFNLNVFKFLLVKMNSLRESYGKDVSFTVIPVGKKMLKACSHLEDEDISVIPHAGVDSKMEADKVNEFTLDRQKAFLNSEFDLVEVIYMSFHSMARQRPAMAQLFPVVESQIAAEASHDSKEENQLYIFEPDPNAIFNEVLPMFVLSTMQQITIENRASEQAARVMAMQSANDNAHKLLEELQLEYNKLRQQSITTELLDIIGGQAGR